MGSDQWTSRIFCCPVKKEKRFNYGDLRGHLREIKNSLLKSVVGAEHVHKPNEFIFRTIVWIQKNNKYWKSSKFYLYNEETCIFS